MWTVNYDYEAAGPAGVWSVRVFDRPGRDLHLQLAVLQVEEGLLGRQGDVEGRKDWSTTRQKHEAFLSLDITLEVKHLLVVPRGPDVQAGDDHPAGGRRKEGGFIYMTSSTL